MNFKLSNISVTSIQVKEYTITQFYLLQDIPTSNGSTVTRQMIRILQLGATEKWATESWTCGTKQSLVDQNKFVKVQRQLDLN